MIHSCASVFISGPESLQAARDFVTWGIPIQAAFYLREHTEWADGLIDIPKGMIPVVHLPKGLFAEDYKPGGFVSTLVDKLGAKDAVVHPWASDLKQAVAYVKEAGNYTLCLETFALKEVNGKGSPITLLAQFGDELTEEHLGICVDFSHLHTDLLTYGFLKSLIPYSKVWHLSGRKGTDQHQPFMKKDLEVNFHTLASSLLDIKNFPIKEVVLEYMPDYHRRLKDDVFYLRDFISSKRRKHGEV